MQFGLGIAFISGLLMKQVGLPTLIGFLSTGFLLNYLNLTDGNLKEILSSLSDLGITLLLFTIGLKIKLKTLVKKEIIITASLHMIISTLAFASFLFFLSYSGLRFLQTLAF